MVILGKNRMDKESFDDGAKKVSIILHGDRACNEWISDDVR